MPTKDDVECARRESFEEGHRQAFDEANKRAELEGGYPPSIACILALVDGLHRRRFPSHDALEVVRAYLEAETAKARGKETT